MKMNIQLTDYPGTPPTQLDFKFVRPKEANKKEQGYDKYGQEKEQRAASVRARSWGSSWRLHELDDPSSL